MWEILYGSKPHPFHPWHPWLRKYTSGIKAQTFLCFREPECGPWIFFFTRPGPETTDLWTCRWSIKIIKKAKFFRNLDLKVLMSRKKYFIYKCSCFELTWIRGYTLALMLRFDFFFCWAKCKQIDFFQSLGSHIFLPNFDM